MKCMSLSGTLIETSSELMLSSDRASFDDSFTNENNLEHVNGELLVSYPNTTSKQVKIRLQLYLQSL